MAGEDIGDQGFGLGYQKTVLILVPFHRRKTGIKKSGTVFPAEFFVEFVCGQDDPAVKILDQTADFRHMVCAVGAAVENTSGF